MSGGLAEAAVGAEAIDAERRRILSTVLERLDTLARDAVAAMRAEIPAYAAHRDERFFDDVTEQVRLNYRTNLTSLLEERRVTLDDIAFVRGAATRRARAGFALEDYIAAFRVGSQVLWDAVVTCAGETSVGHEAALTLAAPVMRYADFASTQASHAYVEFQQHALAEADRERRDLLEHLLAGELPVRGPLVATAEAYGLRPDVPMMVVAAVPVDPHAGADSMQAASAAIARAGRDEARTLVVVRQAEIVAVPALRARTGPDELCDRFQAVQEQLQAEGMALAMGIGTVAADVTELPRAYREARTALEALAGEAGVSALPRLSAFSYLALRADETARRLVDTSLRAFLAEDRSRGGTLVATIRAFADADLNLRVAAERLHVHPNTAQYRLRRIQERTGRNPRRIADLLDLLVAIAMDDANGGGR
jgi:sugar diacid utilization regulator